MSASRELQAALHARLAGDAALTARLGGPRIHDGAPPRTAYPFVSFGDVSASRYGGLGGEEHRLELHVWTRRGGQAEALAIAELVALAAVDLPAMLGDHHLSNIHRLGLRTLRLRDGRAVRATVELRAVTEPA